MVANALHPDHRELRAADLTPHLLAEAAHALALSLNILVDAREAFLLASDFPATVSSYLTAREAPRRWFAGWSTSCTATRLGVPTGGGGTDRRVPAADCAGPVSAGQRLRGGR